MERDESLKADWKVLVADEAEAERLVYVDETSANTSLPSPCAWAPKGEACWSVPRNRGPNTTLLAGVSVEGMGPCLAVVGPTTAAVFEVYVEEVLAPSLRRGQILVMDNLAAHKGERVKGMIKGRGCEPLYLPPYSPDLNPIGEAFAKIKGLMRRTEARTRETLVGRSLAQRSLWSRLGTLRASSSTAGMARRSDRYD